MPAVNSIKPVKDDRSAYTALVSRLSTWYRRFAEDLRKQQREIAEANPMISFRLMGQAEMAELTADLLACEAHPVDIPVFDMGFDLSELVMPHIHSLINTAKAFSQHYGVEQPRLAEIINGEMENGQ